MIWLVFTPQFVEGTKVYQTARQAPARVEPGRHGKHVDEFLAAGKPNQTFAGSRLGIDLRYRPRDPCLQNLKSALNKLEFPTVGPCRARLLQFLRPPSAYPIPQNPTSRMSTREIEGLGQVRLDTREGEPVRHGGLGNALGGGHQGHAL